MTDFRRTLLWVIFAMSLVMLWDAWNRHNGQPTLFGAPVAQPAASAPPLAATPAASAVAAVAGALPGSAPAAAAAETFTVTTDVLRLGFSTRGGEVDKAELLKYPDSQHADRPVMLLDESPQRVYLAQTGLLPAAGGAALPNHFTTLTAVPGPRTLADGQDTLTVRFESAPVGGVKLVKTYTLQRGSYAIAVQHDVVNVGTAPVQPQLYVQLMRDGSPPPDHSSFYFTFTGPALYTAEGKFQKVEFKDIEKRGSDPAKHVTRANDGWVAMVQHYFVSAWLQPADPKPGATQVTPGPQREFRTETVGPNLYRIAMVYPLPAIAPQATYSHHDTLFIGPQEEKKLEQMATGFELVKDYGWVHILSKPLFWLLDKIHGVLGNWGWAIIALVVLLKAAFFGLNAKAYKSMAKMRAVNPRIMALRERLKDKPQEMQQEMMRIYREEKINPLGGCLPILVQMPVFIALYWVLLSSVEMRGAPWLGWITDLSAKDPYYILPILMTLSSLLMQWLQPTPPDPVQAKMMWIMPLAFSVMFFIFPAGLVLYWLTNNLLSIAQQWVINKRLGVA
ncbi:MAG: membrane protein insertase YidC [Proteobacteria bacterium]|nr:membrane protein insertase YidC [Pseudomonadota bacterium]